MQKKEFFIIPYDNFDKLVHETFQERDDFNFAAEMEAANDVYYAFYNMGSEPINIESLNNSFEKWIRKDIFSYFGIDDIIEKLILMGKLEKGNYLINVSW